MNNNITIGIIVADIDEYIPFLEVVKKYNPEDILIFNKKGISFYLDKAKILCVNCGIGKVNAASVAAALITTGCNIILNFGLSGGIDGASRGGICVPDKFLEHDFDLTVLGYKPCEKPRQKYIYNVNKDLETIFKTVSGSKLGGTAVCGDKFISSKADSQFLKEAFSATSCDMETGAIASVCDMAGVPFAALRRISDDAGDTATESYNEMNTSGELFLPQIFLSVLDAVIKFYGGQL